MIWLGRRGFLKGAAAGSIGTLAMGTGAIAAPQVAAPPAPKLGPGPAEGDPVGQVEVLTTDRPGSDFMVDVIKSLGFEYVAANPGSSFRSLHESIVNYGGNKSPELLTCCHEESSVGDGAWLRQRRRQADAGDGAQHGGPAACGDGHLQRLRRAASRCSSLSATRSTRRCGGLAWSGTTASQDAAAMVRDYTKWDDTPVSLTHFAESAVRAYKIAMTLPMGPVVIVADSELQERADRGCEPAHPEADARRAPRGRCRRRWPKWRGSWSPPRTRSSSPAAPRARQEGMELLVELAETLQAPVQGCRSATSRRGIR